MNPNQPNDRELQRAGTFDCPNCGYHAWVWGLPPSKMEPAIKWRTCPDCQDRGWGDKLDTENYFSKVSVELEDGSWDYVRCERCTGLGSIEDKRDG